MSRKVLITPDPHKAKADANMAAFDKLPPDVRRAIADAPYGIPSHAVSDARQVKGLCQRLLEDRDVTGVGPAPTHATRKRRARRI